MHNTRTRTRNPSFLVKPDPNPTRSPTRQGLVLKRGLRKKYCAFLFDCLFKKKQNLCIFDKTVCFRTGTYIATQRLMETLEQSAIFGWEFDRKIFYRQGHTIILVFLFIVQGGPVYGTQWWKCVLQDPRWCRKENNTFTYIPAFSTSWILLMNMCENMFLSPSISENTCF